MRGICIRIIMNEKFNSFRNRDKNRQISTDYVRNRKKKGRIGTEKRFVIKLLNNYIISEIRQYAENVVTKPFFGRKQKICIPKNDTIMQKPAEKTAL